VREIFSNPQNTTLYYFNTKSIYWQAFMAGKIRKSLIKTKKLRKITVKPPRSAEKIS
jgi:hypothetical protein